VVHINVRFSRQSTMCAAVGQSVAMHTAQRRFGGSYQCTIISNVNSTTRNGPRACCPPRNNNAAGTPPTPRPPHYQCLIRRRRRDRGQLQGPPPRMTRRTRMISRHPVPGREDAKPGRRLYLPNQPFSAYTAYSTHFVHIRHI
jgi:hypothetical protein